MSHCTKFNMSFNNKKLLYRAMRNLKMNPQNVIWEEYSSQFTKMFDISGNIIGRLLTGTYHDINIFFTETENGFIPNFESHRLDEIKLDHQGKQILNLLQKEYLRCIVNETKDNIILKGVNVRIIEDENGEEYSLVLAIGDDSKSISFNMDKSGNISEKVSGIIGKTCADLTEDIELSMAGNVDRVWTYEYDEVIEDQVIQVLKLTEN